jgi:hypothetical protein
MAQSARNIPANFPQPLGMQLLKADAERRASMVRQEIVTDLLAILAEARENAVRSKLVRLSQANFKTAQTCAQRARELWPDEDEIEKTFADRPEIKPVQLRKHRKLFDQLNKVHQRSLSLLDTSFEHIQLILDRLQPSSPIDAANTGLATSTGPVSAPAKASTPK